MKTIPETFPKLGWNFRQIKRKGDLAIFERSKPETLPHYEVVRIRQHQGFQIPGTDEVAEPAELYPGNTAWGRDGFTLNTIEEAEAKFQKIVDGRLIEILKIMTLYPPAEQ